MLNKLIKYIGITSLIIALLLGLTALYLILNKEQIKQYALAELNKELDAKITVNQIDISLFSQFPKVSLALHDVLVADATRPGKHLIEAEYVYAGFNLLDVIRKNYKIRLITIENGQIDLFINQEGNHNFKLFKTVPNTNDKNQSSFLVSLNEIKLKRINFTYNNQEINQLIKLNLTDVFLGGNFTSTSERLYIKGDMLAMRIKLGNFFKLSNKTIKTDIDFQINHSTQTFTITKGDIALDLLKLVCTGSITNLKKGTSYQVGIQAKELDIKGFLSMIPGTSKLSDSYISEGSMNLAATINGVLSASSIPEIKASANINKAKVSNDNISLTDLELKSNVLINNTKQEIHINTLSAKLGKENIQAELFINSFSNPSLSLKINAGIMVDDLLKMVPIAAIQSASGRISINYSFQGLLKDIDKKNWLANQSSGSAKFQINHLQLTSSSIPIKQFNGKLLLANADATVNDLYLTYGSQTITGTCKLNRLIAYILGKENILDIDGVIQANQIILEDWMSASTSNSTSNGADGIALLNNQLNLKLACSINELNYKKVKLTQVKLNLHSNGDKLNIDGIEAYAWQGRLEGQSQLYFTNEKQLLFSGTVKLMQINMEQAFVAFDNFGQQEVTAEHIRGTLTGDIDFFSVWNKQLVCDLNKLYVSSKVKITGGELIAYKPLESLAKFVDINELKHLKFEELTNQIEIKNKTIYLPLTTIKNNALNLTIQGTHTFDNFIDYNVKIKLSELLRKKRKSTTENEFNEEETQDGGANIYLNLKGPIDQFKVTYDKKSVKQKMSQELKKEKQEIKDLLKKELGSDVDENGKKPYTEKEMDKDEIEFEPDN